MTSTPDIEQDAAARLAALYNDVVVDTNLWPGPERPARGDVPQESVFVELVDERRKIYGGGQVRELIVQFVVRSSRDDYYGGEERARLIYDALHLSGAFVGEVTSPAVSYIDVVAEGGGRLYLGQQDDGSHQWLVTLAFWVDA